MMVGVLAHGQSLPPVRPPAGCKPEIVRKLYLSCTTDEPCPLYLELTDAELIAGRIIAAGNIHTPAATLESVLFVSDDSGKTWKEAHARVPAGSLTSIQFFDFEKGWISGHVLQPDARDPFFLITSDGGKTWRRQPVYSEPKTGFIERFRFDSATSGVMSIDRGRSGENGFRYELWESLTGGDSWNIRQVDAKPIPFPGGDPPPKALRIRADAPSQTYLIEKQDAGKWAPVAAFALNLDPCKPEEPVVSETPPPEPQLAPQDATPAKAPPSLKSNK
jgi:hypothetical protein